MLHFSEHLLELICPGRQNTFERQSICKARCDGRCSATPVSARASPIAACVKQSLIACMKQPRPVNSISTSSGQKRSEALDSSLVWPPSAPVSDRPLVACVGSILMQSHARNSMACLFSSASSISTREHLAESMEYDEEKETGRQNLWVRASGSKL